MREGVTNKGWGYRAARRGHKQGRGVIALKKEHINEHLNAQERGHRKEVGGSREKRARRRKTSKRKTSEKKRRRVQTNERKASDRKMSVTKPNARESERTKNEREQNENERASFLLRIVVVLKLRIHACALLSGKSNNPE